MTKNTLIEKDNNQLIVQNNLPSIENYQAYKRYVKTIPNLTEEQEEDLVQKMLKEKDINAAKQLVLSQLKTVVQVAQQYKNYGLPEEDLVQEGNIGLMKAVKNFNPDKKVRLYTYALIWIKAEMQAYIMKNLKMVSLPSTKAMKKLFFNFRKLQQEMIGLGVSKEKILSFMSSKLDVTENEIIEAQNYFLSDDVSIFDDTDNDESVNPMMQKFLIEDKKPEYYLEEDQKEKSKEYILETMLSSLNERQRKVIELRYLNEEKKTHKEIADGMGVSNERVRQIEQESLLKMKKNILNKYSVNDIKEIVK